MSNTLIVLPAEGGIGQGSQIYAMTDHVTAGLGPSHCNMSSLCMYPGEKAACRPLGLQGCPQGWECAHLTGVVPAAGGGC